MGYGEIHFWFALSYVIVVTSLPAFAFHRLQVLVVTWVCCTPSTCTRTRMPLREERGVNWNAVSGLTAQHQVDESRRHQPHRMDRSRTFAYAVLIVRRSIWFAEPPREERSSLDCFRLYGTSTRNLVAKFAKLAKANPLRYKNFSGNGNENHVWVHFSLKVDPYGTKTSTRTEKKSRRTPGISLSRRIS